MIEIFLPLSVLLCAMGPLVGRLSEKSRSFHLALMMLLLIILVSILTVQLLPEVLNMFGILGFSFVLLGLFLTWFAERSLFSKGAARLPRLFWLFVVILHSLLDGLSIFIASNHLHQPIGADSHSHSLGWCVVLHRAILIPLLWGHLQPYSFGLRVAVMAVIAACTLIGYVGGTFFLIDPRVIVAVEAVVTGGLLHINLEVLRKLRKGLA
tara:strand:- start:109 stop:738 length:630 start_codon:yes stop_codon:yes gene_type:complete